MSIARNPFERLLASRDASLDMARPAPRDLMADAFLSQMFERLAEADRAGFVPGYPMDSRFMAYANPYLGGEMNGLPRDSGFEGIHNTYRPHRFATQHLGNHGGAMPPTHRGGTSGMDPFAAAELGYDPMLDPVLDGMEGAMGQDALGGDYATAIYEQDLTPFSGPDATTEPLSGRTSPVQMADNRLNPFGSDPMFLGNETRALTGLERAVRPGMASLNALGYQPPPGSTDPYGQDMRNYLRKLLRVV